MVRQAHHERIKSAITLRSISFELAAHFFLDPLALSFQDRIENGEHRWQTLGMVESCLVLLVAHAAHHHEDDEVIRIISARKADKKERKNYEENR